MRIISVNPEKELRTLVGCLALITDLHRLVDPALAGAGS